MDLPVDVNRVLSQSMGPNLHWFPRDISPARLAAVLVGMANTAGGIVLIGVAPRSAHIQGIGDLSETLDRVFQAALMADPPLVLPLPQVIGQASNLPLFAPTTETVAPPRVLMITVPPGLPHLYNLDGRYLWREGTQTNPIPARQLRQLLLERGLIAFEAQLPPGASEVDLDADKIAEYIHLLDFVPPLDTPLPTGQASNLPLLVRRGCLAPDFRPTYAALALFGCDPQRWLPSATILAAHFSGRTFADQYIKREIGGTLPDQLRQAELFVRENLHSNVSLSSLVHRESWALPLEAIREVLVNAVAHRDYNLGGDMIHLNIFSDRLEVHSPGGLPGPVTLDNLLEARFSRNAVIVQVLADMGFIERLGYGLDRVVGLMHQYGLPPPRFEEIGGTFRVTLYTALQAEPPPQSHLTGYPDLNLNTRQEIVLNYLARQRRITNRDYQDLCRDVHPETLRRDLAELVSIGLLLKIGDKKSTYYILKKADNS